MKGGILPLPGGLYPNSSYSRTELCEQMIPGSNSTNWTFAQGGNMKGRLAIEDWVRVKTKILKDLKTTDTELIHTDAWGNDHGYTFPEYVGLEPFELEVKVSEENGSHPQWQRFKDL